MLHCISMYFDVMVRVCQT